MTGRSWMMSENGLMMKDDIVIHLHDDKRMGKSKGKDIERGEGRVREWKEEDVDEKWLLNCDLILIVLT